MADPRLTLADLFLGPAQTLSTEESGRLEQASHTDKVREGLAAHPDAGGWPLAWQQIQAHVHELFDVPLLDILMASWAGYGRVCEHAAADPAHPNKREIIDLEKRALSSTHKPRVELRIDDHPVTSLPFTIKLELQFKVLRLTVGDGRIWRIESGGCKGSGSVQLGGQTILERSFPEVPLPGRMEFASGVAIPTPERLYRWGEAPRALSAGG